jgi:hypothetical protein
LAPTGWLGAYRLGACREVGTKHPAFGSLAKHPAFGSLAKHPAFGSLAKDRRSYDEGLAAAPLVSDHST